MVRIFLGALLVSAAATTAFAGSPSAVLPKPTFRPSLPISVASLQPAPEGEAEPACDLKRLMRVEHGTAKAVPEGFVLDVYGEADSVGWIRPRLALSDQDRGVAVVDFIACRPEAAHRITTPVETHIGLGLDPRTTRIVVRSRTNDITLDVTN